MGLVEMVMNSKTNHPIHAQFRNPLQLCNVVSSLCSGDMNFRSWLYLSPYHSGSYTSNLISNRSQIECHQWQSESTSTSQEAQRCWKTCTQRAFRLLNAWLDETRPRLRGNLWPRTNTNSQCTEPVASNANSTHYRCRTRMLMRKIPIQMVILMAMAN